MIINIVVIIIKYADFLLFVKIFTIFLFKLKQVLENQEKQVLEIQDDHQDGNQDSNQDGNQDKNHDGNQEKLISEIQNENENQDEVIIEDLAETSKKHSHDSEIDYTRKTKKVISMYFINVTNNYIFFN